MTQPQSTTTPANNPNAPTLNAASPLGGQETIPSLRLDCTPVMVSPNQSAQLIATVKGETTLRGLELYHPETKEPVQGISILRVYVGRECYPKVIGDQHGGSWTESFGKTAPKDSYLATVLYNDTGDHIPVGGSWHGSPGAAPAHPNAAQVPLVEAPTPAAPFPNVPQAVAAPIAANQAFVPSNHPNVPPNSPFAAQVAQAQAQGQAAQAAKAAGPAATSTAAPITKAGANEVLVPLSRENLRRLHESLTCGPAITDYEKWDLIRRFDTALRSA